VRQLIVQVKAITPRGRIEPVLIVLDPVVVSRVLAVVLQALRKEVPDDHVTLTLTGHRTDD